MDYSICNGLSFKSYGLKSGVTVYDVNCIWCINFPTRLSECSYLDIGHWKIEDLIFGIGKFHLNAHVKECFPRFSLNFIRGIGQVDGEIMETNWFPFNKIAGFARVMTPSHRSEVYDDYMRDANWKKIVGIGKCIYNIIYLYKLKYY